MCVYVGLMNAILASRVTVTLTVTDAARSADNRGGLEGNLHNDISFERLSRTGSGNDQTSNCSLPVFDT